VVIGVVAALALFNYVGGIEDRANEKAQRVEVFVVRQDIPEGTFGEEAEQGSLIERDEVAAEFRPANAITSFDQIRGKVAASRLVANQVVLTDMFVDPSVAAASFADRISPSDRVAITISVDQVRGVAGLLVPGDEVNILVTRPSADGGSVFSQPARYLYQKVKILAVGQRPIPQAGDTAAVSPDGQVAQAAGAEENAGLITFSVPPEAAQRISSVAPESIYLTLVPDDFGPEVLPPIDPGEALPGERSEALTPYGPLGDQGVE
jgi:pilus assembly protein CpaB